MQHVRAPCAIQHTQRGDQQIPNVDSRLKEPVKSTDEDGVATGYFSDEEVKPLVGPEIFREAVCNQVRTCDVHQGVEYTPANAPNRHGLFKQNLQYQALYPGCHRCFKNPGLQCQREPPD